MLTDQELANRKLAANLLDRYKHNDHDGILALVTEDCVFTIGAGKSRMCLKYRSRPETSWIGRVGNACCKGMSFAQRFESGSTG